MIHRFPNAGTYQAVVLRDGQRVGTTCFRVTDETAGTQLNIDLASVALPTGGAARCDCREHTGERTLLSPARYVLFHRREARAATRSGRGGREGGKAVFDSQALSDGDLFALALIEPMTYSVASPGGAGHGEIQLSANSAGTNLRKWRR